MKCQEKLRFEGQTLPDQRSINKKENDKFKKIMRIKNLEIARERWDATIEKFVEEKNKLGNRVDESKRLESIATELWKLKNVEEEPKAARKIKPFDKDHGSFLRCQIAEKEATKREERIRTCQEKYTGLKFAPNEKVAEQFRKKDKYKEEILAQIKCNCVRSRLDREQQVREGRRYLEMDDEQMIKSQTKTWDAKMKAREEIKSFVEIHEKRKREIHCEKMKECQEFECLRKAEMEKKEKQTEKSCDSRRNAISDMLRRNLEREMNEKERDERMRIELSWMEKDLEAELEEKRRIRELEEKANESRNLMRSYLEQYTAEKEFNRREEGERVFCQQEAKEC